MTSYAFTVMVDGLDLDDDTQIDRLYRDDWMLTPAVSDGLATIGVELDAPDAEKAVAAAIGFLSPVVQVLRVDPELVTVPEVAERLRVSRETVRLWATGQRGDGNFPGHQMVVGGQRMWPWHVIDGWAREHGRIDGDAPRPLPVPAVDRANVRLWAARTADG